MTGPSGFPGEQRGVGNERSDSRWLQTPLRQFPRETIRARMAWRFKRGPLLNAYHELGRQFHMVRIDPLAATSERRAQCDRTHLLERLTHRGQWRRGDAGYLCVVEADDADVVGAPRSRPSGPPRWRHMPARHSPRRSQSGIAQASAAGAPREGRSRRGSRRCCARTPQAVRRPLPRARNGSRRGEPGCTPPTRGRPDRRCADGRGPPGAVPLPDRPGSWSTPR